MLSKGASAYAVGYSDYISDVPLCSSGYDLFDGDIPFYQMVMHGLVPYASTSVNGDADPDRLVLLAAASGSGLSFDMIYDEISELKDTEYDIYYYADSGFWTETAAAEYRFVRDVLSGTAGEFITGYSSDGRNVTTEYSSGTVITVDLEDGTAERDGKKFVLSEYLAGKGGS